MLAFKLNKLHSVRKLLYHKSFTCFAVNGANVEVPGRNRYGTTKPNRQSLRSLFWAIPDHRYFKVIVIQITAAPL